MDSTTLASLGADNVGVVVTGRDGRVRAANVRARELLHGQSATELAERVRELCRGEVPATGESPSGARPPAAARVSLPDAGPLRVRVYPIEDADESGCVVLIEEAGLPAGLDRVLREAARYRAFAALCRDWAHECKGMLNVIQVNHALLTRSLHDGGSGSASVARCLESIPREIGRLDRSIDLVLRSSDDDRRSRFDVGLTAERLVSIVEARARRQHVTTSLELTGGSREISGFEDRLGGAVLNLLVNALDAMPDEGRLGVTVHGGPLVRITICDSGPGLAAGEDDSVHAPDGDGIGLLVARSVVEAHQGRMSCRANPPRGTCVELDLPVGAATAEDEAWRMR